jgi:hypothetical protein
MNLQARYKTLDLVELFTELENDGYLGMNMKLITDLIATRLEEVPRIIRPIILEEEAPQLSMSELAELTHARQVELFNWCSCEDGPKVWDDCTQDGK